ncbi:Eukaryotic translation initiation factor 3 subunit J [Hondaea fermentalgiana]|uniref:Eukaryotic translation initiation factor 3 subunit J n=1 Tax=Hondaea fermentalgiana TaxID=2315210 RepID=A0A2R5GJ71_9STRA|nr:Eukaryotic translation initiation factor 3 subunit J [Hondaea fermentalgiana]|eukprot:GBG30665.1 Eukaryotic translation initiation factor 3 subunit J [Hondaea fermentalgiana]
MSWDDDDWETAADQVLAAADGVDDDKAAAAALEDSDDEEVVDFGNEAEASEATKARKQGDAAKAKAKKMTKAKKKEMEEKLEKEAEALRNAKPLSKEEKIAEKQRLQQLAEESDLSLMGEMFQAKKDEGTLDAQAIQSLLQAVPLEEEEQYKDFASAIGHRIEVEDDSFMTKEFLKELCRHLGRTIKGEDFAEVVAVLNVIKNERVKTDQNKKKKKVGKKFANVARSNTDDLADFSGADARGLAHAASYVDENLDGDFM